ncbi:Lysophospholipid acyltransferase, partial [Rhizina undulata]
FAWLSSILGTSKDELKIIFCVLFAYPMAGVLKRLPDAEPWKKNLFMIAVSLFYLVGVFDLWGGIRTLFISSAGAYLIAAYIQGPYMPWIGFVYLLSHMLYSHIYRELYPRPGVVDVTGAQMVLVMKLTAFCWSVHDGRLPQSELSDFQKDRAIPQLPGILDYTAYVLYFPSLFTGPAFDFAEYRRYIDCTMFDVTIPDTKRGGTKRKRRIPSSSIPATKKAIYGLGWIFLFLKLSAYFPAEFALSNDFLAYSFFGRVIYIYGMGFSARLKYYGIWFLSEGACILSGLGYNGLDENKQPRWDRITNVRPWDLETAQNTRAYLEAWNMNTNKWLRNYVYLRVTPKGKKPGFRSSLATFGTSAIWHGISPGYYLTFITASLVQTVGKYFRRHVRPFFLEADGKTPGKYKRAYDIFGMVVTQISFSYVVAPFIILKFTDSLVLWARVKFFVHIGIIVCMIFFHSSGKTWLNSLLKQKAGRTAPKSPELEPSRTGPLGLPEEPLEDMGEIHRELMERKREFDAARKSALKTQRRSKKAN